MQGDRSRQKAVVVGVLHSLLGSICRKPRSMSIYKQHLATSVRGEKIKVVKEWHVRSKVYIKVSER